MNVLLPGMRYRGWLLFLVFFITIPVVPDCSHAGSADPWKHVESKAAPVSHTNLFPDVSFSDGPSVTRACLKCHPGAAKEVMGTTHWTWLSEPQPMAGRSEPVRIGKKNSLNNFCISIESNWPRCTTCHVGYGWEDADFDFSIESNVDCLICHDQSGGYLKIDSGYPAADVDLLASARSVGLPSRDNCGICHFNGGGGNAVKHGDLDSSLSHPGAHIDVHMGRLNFKCTTCHRTEKHDLQGRMMSVNTRDITEVQCTDCHAREPHRVARLNDHTATVACQTCHVPEIALKQLTKVAWDWSTAGQDIPDADPHKYMQIKGSFVYDQNLRPEYRWYNGSSVRYIKGDKIDPETVTHITFPQGDIADPTSRIWPFKVHRGKQPYDPVLKHLLVIHTYGKGGFWEEFDWIKAAETGSKAAGLPFSGEVGFTETDMYWELTHMIATRERALQCIDCHSPNGRMHWQALGYDGDPAGVGGRRHQRLVTTEKETDR